MIRALDLSDGKELSEMLRLQKASYAVEADLIGSSEIPQLGETPRALRHCGETFRGYFLEGELVAAISYKTEDGVLDVHRLVVRPDLFRRGIARSLMRHVEATEPSADSIVASTGAANHPATSLYQSLGFRRTGERKVAAGLRVASFEKTIGDRVCQADVTGRG